MNDENIPQNAVLVFGSETCAACKAMLPIIEKMDGVYYLDVEDYPRTAHHYAVRSLPTTIKLKNGELVDMHVGLMSRRELEKMV